MSQLYDRIAALCEDRGVNVTAMCKEAEVSRASLTDLKQGRKANLSAETLRKLAAYFDVTVDYLLGRTDEPTPAEIGTADDAAVKFALFGGDGEITDEMYEEVKRFAAFIKEKYKKS